MALGDSLLSLADGIQPTGSGPLAAGGSAGNTDAHAVSIKSGRIEFARRVRQWYLAAVAHPLWATYIKQSGIDEGFYIGGDLQWVDNDGSKEDFEMLRRQKRATISINQIKPIIKVLTGLERQSRYDFKMLPQGEEDEEDARMMTWLYKFVVTQLHIHDLKSQAFKNSLIRGMSVLFAGMQWDDDPAAGDIVTEVLQPGLDCIWDPHWTMPDFSDASYFLRYKWVWIREVKAQYPEFKQEIEEALGDLNAILSDLSLTGGTSRGPSGDGYGSVVEPNIDQLNFDRYFYDPVLQRVLVVEAWYKDYEAKWYIFRKDSGKLEEVPDEVPNPGQYARIAQEADPSRVQAIKRVRQYLRTGTVLPATHTTLEEDSTPYENDRQAFPYSLIVSERTGDDIRGMVRDLRDAQRVENKRVSQAIDLVVRWGKIRRVAEENSLDPRSEQAINDPLAEGVLWYRTGKQPPTWDVPQGVADLTRLLIGLADQMKVNMKETSGINASLLGNERDQSASGIAMARRQAQGQIIATEVFDQYRWATQIFGQRLGRRIQQKFTGDEYIRLTNDVGASLLVHMNPSQISRLENPDERKSEVKKWRAAARNDITKPAILADVSKFKWDLVLSETPSSPTARAEALEALLKLINSVPNFAPVLADKLIAMTDGIPDKPEILARIQAMMQAQFGPIMEGQAPPPAPPGSEGIGDVPRSAGDNTGTVQPPPPGAPKPGEA